jgi:hypothetical protein
LRPRFEGVEVRVPRRQFGGTGLRHAVKHQQPGDNQGAQVRHRQQHDASSTDEVAPPASPLAMVRAVACLQVSGRCKGQRTPILYCFHRAFSRIIQ